VRRGTRGARDKQQQEHAYERKIYREKLGETGSTLKMVAKKEENIPVVVEWHSFDESDYTGVPGAIVDGAYEGTAGYDSGPLMQSIAKNSPKISRDPVLYQPSLTKNRPCPLPSQQVIDPPSRSPILFTANKKKMIKKIYEVLAQQNAWSQKTPLS
jgi:hypothetical protein